MHGQLHRLLIREHVRRMPQQQVPQGGQDVVPRLLPVWRDAGGKGRVFRRRADFGFNDQHVSSQSFVERGFVYRPTSTPVRTAKHVLISSSQALFTPFSPFHTSLISRSSSHCPGHRYTHRTCTGCGIHCRNCDANRCWTCNQPGILTVDQKTCVTACPEGTTKSGTPDWDERCVPCIADCAQVRWLSTEES